MKEKFTVRETHILRKLDTALYSGSPASIDTQFGEVVVRKSMAPGYVAELRDGDDIPRHYAAGPTPSIAFLKLADVVRAAEAKRRADETARRVLDLRPDAGDCPLCYLPIGPEEGGYHPSCEELEKFRTKSA